MAGTNLNLPFVKKGDLPTADGENDLRRIVNALTGVGDDAQIIATAGGRFIRNPQRRSLETFVAKIGDTAISAISGDAPGSQLLPIYQFDIDGNLMEVLNSDGSQLQLTVYNITDSDSPTNAYVPVIEERETGQMIAVLGSTTTTTTTGTETGLGTCSCDNCYEGVTIPNATECCKSHLRWSMTNPWLECATTDITFYYESPDKLISDPPFMAPNGNEYRYEIALDVGGQTYMTLKLATDNGGDTVCLIYGRDGWDCQCDNVMTIKKPFGQWSGIDRNQLTCDVCVQPVLPTAPSCADQPAPPIFKLEVVDPGSGFGRGPSDTVYLVPATNSCLSGGLPLGEVVWQGTYDDPVDSGETVTVTAWCVRSVSPFHVALSVVFSWCGGVYVTGTNWYSFYNADFDLSVLNNLDEVSTYLSALHTPLDRVISLEPINAQTPPTSSGACADTCDTTPVAPPEPAGCCCIDYALYHFVDAADCAALGGTWTDPCDEGACVDPEGHCCMPDGRCIGSISQSSCSAIGGTFGSGTSCVGACTGACCDATSETCVITTEANCQDTNDYWYGIGTDCTGVDCTLVACCYPLSGTTCAVNADCHCVNNIPSSVCTDLSGEQDLGNNCGIVVCNCNGGTFTCHIP